MGMNLPTFIEKPDPSIYKKNNYLVLDLETTNLDAGNPVNSDNSLVLWVYKRSYDHRPTVGVGTEFDCGDLVRACESVDFVVAHNAKFELGWLKRAGLDLTKVLPFDTQIAEYVIYGNRAGGRRGFLSLGSVASRRGLGSKDPYVDKMMKAGVCPSELPRQMLIDRCKKDVQQTEGIFKQQLHELERDNLLGVMHTRCILTPVLADIEQNGMHLDCGEVNDTYNSYLSECRKARQELDEFTGGINPNSPKQVQEFVYDYLGFEEIKDPRGNPIRTNGGGRKTDSETLVKLRAETDAQKRFVDIIKRYNYYNSLLSKNLEFFDGICSEKGGILYAQFNQTVTQTHRLSSSGLRTSFEKYDKAKSVQFQNLPRIFKSMFSPRYDDWYMGEIDGSQLEFRVAAYLGQDDRAYYDIVHGVDVHQFTADTLTNAGQPTGRQGAKPHTFKPLYGGESGTEAEKTYYKEFRRKYPGIDQAQQSWINDCLVNGKVTMPWGITFHFPDTVRKKSGYIVNKESICNYPVQSLATAEIIPIAVTYLWHLMKMYNMKSFLVNTVHDSAIAEISYDETELFHDLAVQSFTTKVYEYLYEVYNLKFNVPLGAEIKLGSHWNKGEETKYESEPPFKFSA